MTELGKVRDWEMEEGCGDDGDDGERRGIDGEGIDGGKNDEEEGERGCSGGEQTDYLHEIETGGGVGVVWDVMSETGRANITESVVPSVGSL